MSNSIKPLIARMLTLRQRRACAAIWVDGSTHARNAAAQGISVAASEKRVNRARRRLRALGIDPPDGRRCRAGRRASAKQLGVNPDV